MKQKFLFAYMDVAERFAKLSHARRLQVGAIVVKGDRIISIGYNGMPSGWDNDCEDIIAVDELEPTYKTKKQVLHAESNAITKLAKSTESGNKSTMFCTHSPCIECAKLIFQTGIDTLYYRKDYRSTDGIDFLKASGVTVEQI